jgi:hypothetical protein
MDISKLNFPVPPIPSKEVIADMAKATSSIAGAIEKLRIPPEAFEQLNASAKFAKGAIGPMLETLGETAATGKFMQGIADQHSALLSASGAVGSMMKALGEDSAASKLSRQIADQYRALAALNSDTDLALRFDPPRPPTTLIRDIPNPLHETNERLANIEDRFDRMEAIAIDGAKIATSLQATALDFLVKFETAASNNDRAARRAIRLGIIATIIAVAMPMAQIIYTEFWRVPADADAMQASIVQMKREITNLQETQREVADQISKSLSQSDARLATVLKEIKEMLSSRQQPTKIHQAD